MPFSLGSSPLAGTFRLFAASAALIAGGARLGAADTSAYRQVENWPQMPANASGAMMTAVDVDSRGTVYVFQRGAPARVMAFDPSGKLLRTWGEGTYPSAHGLRVDAQDNVWVTDRGWHQVLKYSPEGKLLLTLGKKGVAGDNNSTDALNGPSDVAFGPKGEIFVSDGESSNTRVVKFSADGKFIKFWGTKGSGPGQLNTPHSIVIDSKGRLYVANRGNKRVEIYDQDGGYLGVITNAGTPYGLFMAKDDILYSVDGTEGKDDLTIIDTKTQKVIDHFGGLTGPHMLSVDKNGAIYVAETKGNAVKKFVKK
ncbi:MAG TPA: peptidyl-alpha-hydroxyglycine alpha-amidating lyase family protein [Opitutaceae bacterium]|nr:peptidyl-alpha-hydroxyglycine alpha-amidating lyase family protein [Lacunisphaera sp.]HWA09077.1 peptidyl-alpha-hydroxyglycine alpha-amidating lyase family protein [Opitutaceae bacterium]